MSNAYGHFHQLQKLTIFRLNYSFWKVKQPSLQAKNPIAAGDLWLLFEEFDPASWIFENLKIEIWKTLHDIQYCIFSEIVSESD